MVFVGSDALVIPIDKIEIFETDFVYCMLLGKMSRQYSPIVPDVPLKLSPPPDDNIKETLYLSNFICLTQILSAYDGNGKLLGLEIVNFR